MIPMIKENLGTGAARTGIAHRPEIIRSGNADDAVITDAGNLLPQIGSLVILVIDGDKQPVLRQSVFFGDQVPGQLDGHVLEIITKREIAQHLEEGVMARRIADILKVIMLAAGPYTFLRCDSAVEADCFQPGKQVLELHHAGIGEHQCRVVLRHKRA